MSIFDREERFVGRDTGGTEYVITREMVDKYVAGSGDDNAMYTGAEAIAPALILYDEVFRKLDWYLPNVYGNLHSRQEWEIFSPIGVGETLRTASVIVDRYKKRDREYVVKEVLVLRPSGELVSRSRTHQSFMRQDARRAEGIVVDRAREKAAERVFKIGERDGERIQTPARTITEAMCMAFSGPRINYHNNREKAVELGFPEIVVQGMLSVCMLAELMTRRFGIGFMLGGRLSVNLVNIMWGNDAAAARGVIVEHRTEGKRTRAECEVWCEKSDGVKVTLGTASAIEL
jgi:acyl dehydratase